MIRYIIMLPKKKQLKNPQTTVIQTVMLVFSHMNRPIVI
nr:MAG TPA: hypothetical protein [Caudoviricetes sp.]DAX32272.1 MAG TPA: hypothetical protein [Caudoviricetes sp.]